MIAVHTFSVREAHAGERPRVGRLADRYDVFLGSVEYGAGQPVDALVIARNQRTGERWTRLFPSEEEGRQMTRAVAWALELVGLEEAAAIL